jgi:hypothetical protein
MQEPTPPPGAASDDSAGDLPAPDDADRDVLASGFPLPQRDNPGLAARQVRGLFSEGACHSTAVSRC